MDITADASVPSTGAFARFDRLLGRIIEAAAAAIVVAELVLLGAATTARYVFNAPLIWSDELATVLFVWLSVLGSAVALRRGEHMRLTAFVRNLSPSQEAEVRNLLALAPGDIYDQIAIDELHAKVAGSVNLKGLVYSFAPSTDRNLNVIDLTLDFFKDAAQSSL